MVERGATIPSAIARLSNLTSIWAGRNLFSSFSSEISLLTGLTSLDFQSNAFVGTFPSIIYKISNLLSM